MNQENVEEEEEEQDNADFFECDEAKKDRSKDNKFKALLSEGSLPDYVVQAWKKTLSMKKGRTEEQRKIVNQVLDRKRMESSWCLYPRYFSCACLSCVLIPECVCLWFYPSVSTCGYMFYKLLSSKDVF